MTGTKNLSHFLKNPWKGNKFNFYLLSSWIAKVESTLWLHNRNYFPSFLNICQNKNIRKAREHTIQEAFLDVTKKFTINPKVHHKKPTQRVWLWCCCAHDNTLYFPCFLSPSFICSFFFTLTQIAEKIYTFQALLFFFFLGQFCNVATLAITHKEI
jgi:hypothetical protein